MSNHAPAEADDQYMAVQATPEFQALRKKFRGFVFPMTAFFLAWYFLYVLLSIFASDFMNKALFGKITIGLVFGLLQFVTTFAITFIYARWANRDLDPAADAVGATLDGQREH
ncbi:MAG TPA: DUF485 domain-containing protein [Phycicoccus elongatus]|uniref:Integral membrane protein n=2 Tax=Intrasporangiaceae TaxID=85021 RepID=N0E5E5_9MICO|nr:MULTISPECIES: DUF485 domain-containing protein [Phycicoccus]CCH70469.1 conserved hypothetical protein [Phycicoccus elongatus Lp2]HPF75294.1 DUF485 domain-containing protein [Phycicoccus elongatus]HRC17962.1 DUF485 domain-containing protein [Phycicoccus elongatus]HRV56614.1 DUF485 domain-containing protein [Phycicoccus sp.]